MRVAMVVVFVVIAVANSANGELRRIHIDDFELSGESGTCWRSAWLDMPGWERLESSIPVAGVFGGGAAMPIASAGDDIDRWWYVYLDRQRYRFLDVTQYSLLTGPRDWRWRRWAWPDVFTPPLPRRYICETTQPVPELWSVTLLALGAAMALRTRRSVAVR